MNWRQCWLQRAEGWLDELWFATGGSVRGIPGTQKNPEHVAGVLDEYDEALRKAFQEER